MHVYICLISKKKIGNSYFFWHVDFCRCIYVYCSIASVLYPCCSMATVQRMNRRQWCWRVSCVSSYQSCLNSSRHSLTASRMNWLPGVTNQHRYSTTSAPHSRRSTSYCSSSPKYVSLLCLCKLKKFCKFQANVHLVSAHKLSVVCDG